MLQSKNGTSLIYYKTRNKIVIDLPPTAETATGTIMPCIKRLVHVPEANLMVLLNITELIFAIGEESRSQQEAKDG